MTPHYKTYSGGALKYCWERFVLSLAMFCVEWGRERLSVAILQLARDEQGP